MLREILRLSTNNRWNVCSLLLVLQACSGGGGEEPCAGLRDLTPCEVSGDGGPGPGVCLQASCTALEPCGAAGCGEGPHFVLADTNLRVCYGSSATAKDGTISCPGSTGTAACGSTDYCGQDGQYGWDLKHAATARFAISTNTPAEPVVTDQVTGLVWQRCAAGQSTANCQGKATLMDWHKARAHCEQASWGGFDDWQLPSTHELHALLDFSTTSPALDRTVFANAPSKFKDEYEQWWKECYWTSTSLADNSAVAWVGMVNSGDISEGSGTPYHVNDKQAKGWDGCYARCVRSSTPRKHRRLLQIDRAADQPVVADTVTRLFWQACSAGQQGRDCSGTAAMKDWKSSLAHCQNLTWGGKDDWRLPNVRELRSLVETSRKSPAIDATMFPHTPYYGAGMTHNNAGQFWSATARSYNDFALYVDFRSGFSHFYKQSEGRHVRCVRDP